MQGASLSPFERMQLATQLRILTKLDPEYAEYHHLKEKIAILEGGFEGDYPRVLGRFVENTVSVEVMNFANRVLLMMSRILDFEDQLGDYDLADVRQVGFDQRDEYEHLSYAQHLFNDELNDFGRITGVVNSHHATLPRYKAMMQVFDKEMEKLDWDVEAAKRVLDAGRLKRRQQ